jgi:thymidine phosphorylase
MEAPLGRAVGNALEIAECIQTLQGGGPADLETIIVTLASRMLMLGGQATDRDAAAAKVRNALTSGAALAKFRAIVAHQGGDPRVVDDPTRLPGAAHVTPVTAEADGYVTGLDAELVGRASMLLGAGRDRVDAVIDPATGIVVRKKPGDAVAAGDSILDLHYNDRNRLAAAAELARSAITVHSSAPQLPPLVRAWVHAEGEQLFA